MPNMNSRIRPHAIDFVSQFVDRHPVFLLEGVDGNLVVKQEGDNRVNVGNSAAIMTSVDPGARSVVLESVEVAALTAISKVCKHGDGCKCDKIKHFLNTGKASTWIKMEAKTDLLDLASAAEARFQGDRTNVKLIAKTLRDTGGLEKLGSIIAADAFNGYNDRFAFDGHGGDLFPPNATDTAPGRLKCLLNVGNVFVCMAPSGGATVVGLDTFDPGSQHKDWRTELNEGVVEWPGRMLADSALAERMAFASMVAEDLETVLGPRNRKNPFGTKRRMPKDAAKRLNAGMFEGAKKIRRSLIDRGRQGYKHPIGLVQRLDALGWLNERDFKLD